MEETFEHWCEVCGRTEVLSSEEAFAAGWDFPPRMGEWGAVTPRTCGACPNNATVWWALEVDGVDSASLDPDRRAVLDRILAEEPRGETSAEAARTDRPARLDLDADGSWIVETSSGSLYRLDLDGDDELITRIRPEVVPDSDPGDHSPRCDGETLPLLGLVDGPIRVGRPATFVIGDLSDSPGYVSTTRSTSPVVAIRHWAD